MKRRKKKTNFTNKRQPDPSATEITAACERIRAGWTGQEELRRRGIAPDDVELLQWQPPTVAVAGILGQHHKTEADE